MGTKTLDELTIQTDRRPGAAWACMSQLPDQRQRDACDLPHSGSGLLSSVTASYSS